MKRSEPKFKRGNLVRVLVGHMVYGGKPFDMAPHTVGKIAIIENVYWDMYGFMFPQTEEQRQSHLDDYSIIYLDTGQSEAWKQTEELELLETGGEYLFEIAKYGDSTMKGYKEKILKKYYQPKGNSAMSFTEGSEL